MYLIVSCVTLNQPDRDTELVCRYTVVDRHAGDSVDVVGLGDDPSRYRFHHEGTLLRVDEAS